MKKLLLLPVIAIIVFSSCKDEEGLHTAQMEKIKDTVFKTYPTVAGVTVKISDDAREYTVILGDKQLYVASEERQKIEAYAVSGMVLDIFGKENEFKKGTVIISKDEKSEQPGTSDSKTMLINLDSFKKAR